MRERESARTSMSMLKHEQEGGVEEEGEADSPLSREPDAGLNPRTLGS